jgi:hypothetical protein
MRLSLRDRAPERWISMESSPTTGIEEECFAMLKCGMAYFHPPTFVERPNVVPVEVNRY